MIRDPIPVYVSQVEPTPSLKFVKVDGRLILHQAWRILEWGNREGPGLPMNERVEWRAVPTDPESDKENAS